MQPQIIWWRPQTKNGKQLARVHIMVGYATPSLATFNRLAAELRKTFPQALDEYIGVGVIDYHGGNYDGFTILSWSTYLEKKDYPGFCPSERDHTSQFDYTYYTTVPEQPI